MRELRLVEPDSETRFAMAYRTTDSEGKGDGDTARKGENDNRYFENGIKKNLLTTAQSHIKCL